MAREKMHLVRRSLPLVACGLLAAVSFCQGTLSARDPETAGFPTDLVSFTPAPGNPIFTAEGPGHWDVKIRERGWILREGDAWHLWYTGYDGTREGIKQLGYAQSVDGIKWERWPQNPLVRGHWVEDMMVIKEGETYYMFAEGEQDRAQLLTSTDRVSWKREGTLEIRNTKGGPIPAGPFGTPTAWFEKGTWYLFYEQRDLGVWLAKSTDLKVWTNIQDEPVLVPGPDAYDKQFIALNQIIKRDRQYFAYYHGSAVTPPGTPRTWNTNVARSTDLVHWQKYTGNPIVEGDKSSGIVVFDGKQTRLYTMHNQVDLFLPKEK